MHKKIILPLTSLLLIFSASAYIWTALNNTAIGQSSQGSAPNNPDFTVSKVDLSWQEGSKTVDLDQYIANNQVSQNIIDKKQRVMLEPELINFHGVLQAPVADSKANLVTDALAVWGISPLPEVAFSTYIRSPAGQVIAVYVENTIAEHIKKHYQPEAVLAFQAYRLYNYANGPRLLLVGIKPSDISIEAAAVVANNKNNKNKHD